MINHPAIGDPHGKPLQGIQGRDHLAVSPLTGPHEACHA